MGGAGLPDRGRRPWGVRGGRRSHPAGAADPGARPGRWCRRGRRGARDVCGRGGPARPVGGDARGQPRLPAARGGWVGRRRRSGGRDGPRWAAVDGAGAGVRPGGCAGRDRADLGGSHPADRRARPRGASSGLGAVRGQRRPHHRPPGRWGPHRSRRDPSRVPGRRRQLRRRLRSRSGDQRAPPPRRRTARHGPCRRRPRRRRCGRRPAQVHPGASPAAVGGRAGDPARRPGAVDVDGRARGVHRRCGGVQRPGGLPRPRRPPRGHHRRRGRLRRGRLRPARRIDRRDPAVEPRQEGHGPAHLPGRHRGRHHRRGPCPDLAVLAVLSTVGGFSNGLINATFGAVFVQRVSDSDRGRTGATLNALTRSASLAALALGALAGALFGPRTAITALGAITLLLLAVLVPRTTNQLRRAAAPPALTQPPRREQRRTPRGPGRLGPAPRDRSPRSGLRWALRPRAAWALVECGGCAGSVPGVDHLFWLAAPSTLSR